MKLKSIQILKDIDYLNLDDDNFFIISDYKKLKRFNSLLSFKQILFSNSYFFIKGKSKLNILDMYNSDRFLSIND